MPQKSSIVSLNDRHESKASDTLGKFLIDEHSFKIVTIHDAKNLASSDDHMHEVVRFKLRGRTVAIIEEPARPPELDGDTRNMIARLTGRELQIAAMIAQGDATKNVAYKLRISEWTVGTHLRRIFAKLGVDNRAAMVYRCASLIENIPTVEPKTRRAPASAE
jgi:DNA-binding CsgD family transcriptional regulator